MTKTAPATRARHKREDALPPTQFHSPRNIVPPNEHSPLPSRTNCSTPWEQNLKVILVYLLSSLRSIIRQLPHYALSLCALPLVRPLLEATHSVVACGPPPPSPGAGLQKDSWRYATRESEGILLKEAHDLGVEGLTTYICHTDTETIHDILGKCVQPLYTADLVLHLW